MEEHKKNRPFCVLGGDIGVFAGGNFEERRQRMRDEKRMIRRFVLDLIAVIVAFVALYLALWMGLRAYAAHLPEIFLGTFRNEVAGGNPDDVAQMPLLSAAGV